LNRGPVDYEMDVFPLSLWFSISGPRRYYPPFSLFRQSIVQRNMQRNCDIGICVKAKLSTREAAKKLGVTILTLQRHVTAKTVKAPPLQKIGGVSVRLWTARDIAKAKKVLRAMRPGRKKQK